MTNISAFGIFPDQKSVTLAVEALKQAGFRNTDISVLYPETLVSSDGAPRFSGMRNTPKHRKARWRAEAPEL